MLGTTSLLTGEAFLFGSAEVAILAVVFFLIKTMYFISYEEPGLEGRFGEEYREYKRHVPRWLPPLKPWQAEREIPKGKIS